MSDFTHLDKSGFIRMVDVSDKPGTLRVAKAEGFISMQRETVEKINAGEAAKGNVITTAKIAGIQAAKITGHLIPLCHNLNITWADVQIEAREQGFKILSEVKAKDTTGVEMEALTAVSVTALTIYDMCKAVDKTMIIHDIRLTEKTGGKSSFKAGTQNER